MNREILKLGIFFFVITGALIALYLYGQEFRQNHNLTFGKVLRYTWGGKGNTGPGIYYVYEVDGFMIYSSTTKSRLKYGPHGLINKSFPIIYRKNYFTYVDNILITPDDFEYYGYTFPDSLRWVLPYLNGR